MFQQSSNLCGQRTGICGIALALLFLIQSGCESNGLHGSFRDVGPGQQTRGELIVSTEDPELEEAALVRVQELLADQAQGLQPDSTALAANVQDPGDWAQRPSRPIRLSSVFNGISTQARRFSGRFLVP